MFARLISAQFESEKIDEGIAIWKDKDMPTMESVKGYRGAYLLIERKTGRVISMTLWDSEGEAVADEKSGLHREQVDLYRGLLVGEPVAQYLEVSAKDKIE